MYILIRMKMYIWYQNTLKWIDTSRQVNSLVHFIMTSSYYFLLRRLQRGNSRYQVIVFGLPPSRTTPITYHTRNEHANYCTTQAVWKQYRGIYHVYISLTIIQLYCGGIPGIPGDKPDSQIKLYSVHIARCVGQTHESWQIYTQIL